MSITRKLGEKTICGRVLPGERGEDKRGLVLFAFCLTAVTAAFLSTGNIGGVSGVPRHYSYDGYELTADNGVGDGNMTSITVNCTDCRVPAVYALLFHYPFPLNDAGPDELELLPGIGRKLAWSIYTYRLENGPFEREEDLLAVHGIGPNLSKTLQTYLRLPQ